MGQWGSWDSVYRSGIDGVVMRTLDKLPTEWFEERKNLHGIYIVLRQYSVLNLVKQ